MPDSLLDFIGGMARTAIGLENLEETRRRNDIYEGNAVLEAGRLKIAAERLKFEREQAKQQGFRQLMDLAKDPRVRAVPDLEDAILGKAGQLAGVPEFSPETIRKGRDQRRRLLQGLASGDEQLAGDALIELQIMADPQDVERIVKSVSDTQKMSEYTANVEMLRLTQQTRFEKIHNSMAKINAGQIPYTQGAQDFAVALADTDSPDFQKALDMTEKLRGKQVATSKNIGALVGGESVAKWTGPESARQAANANKMAERYYGEVQQVKDMLTVLEHGGELPPGVTKQDLGERLKVSQELGDAYSVLAEWNHDPFNRKILKSAKDASALIEQRRKDLENLKTSTQEEAIQLRRDAQAFRASEAEKKHLYDVNVGKAQAEVLKTYGYTPTGEQLGEIAEKHGVKASDLNDALNDPSKRGKLGLELKLGQGLTDKQFEKIQVGKKTIRMLDRMEKLVMDNPAVIGKTASMGVAAAGAIQNLRALVRIDPAGTRFLNTKTRDELEALYETLVYAKAKSMDPTGALDLKVVENARTSLGDISSWTAGPKQFLNKIRSAREQTQADLLDAVDLLEGGPEGAIRDARKLGSAPAANPNYDAMDPATLLDIIQKGMQK